MKIIMVCKECTKPADVDKEKSNENWTVYKNTCSKCGGSIIPKVE